MYLLTKHHTKCILIYHRKNLDTHKCLHIDQYSILIDKDLHLECLGKVEASSVRFWKKNYDYIKIDDENLCDLREINLKNCKD